MFLEKVVAQRSSSSLGAILFDIFERRKGRGKKKRSEFTWQHYAFNALCVRLMPDEKCSLFWNAKVFFKTWQVNGVVCTQNMLRAFGHEWTRGNTWQAGNHVKDQSDELHREWEPISFVPVCVPENTFLKPLETIFGMTFTDRYSHFWRAAIVYIC